MLCVSPLLWTFLKLPFLTKTRPPLPFSRLVQETTPLPSPVDALPLQAAQCPVNPTACVSAFPRLPNLICQNANLRFCCHFLMCVFSLILLYGLVFFFFMFSSIFLFSLFDQCIWLYQCHQDHLNLQDHQDLLTHHSPLTRITSLYLKYSYSSPLCFCSLIPSLTSLL